MMCLICLTLVCLNISFQNIKTLGIQKVIKKEEKHVPIIKSQVTSIHGLLCENENESGLLCSELKT